MSIYGTTSCSMRKGIKGLNKQKNFLILKPGNYFQAFFLITLLEETTLSGLQTLLGLHLF